MFWGKVVAFIVCFMIFLFSLALSFLNLPQRVFFGEIYEKTDVVSYVTFEKKYKARVRGHRIHRYTERNAVVKFQHDKNIYSFILNEDKSELSHDDISFAKIVSLINNQKITVVLRKDSNMIFGIKKGDEIIFDDVRKNNDSFYFFTLISLFSLFLSIKIMKWMLY